jgi:hypothetical protein
MNFNAPPIAQNGRRFLENEPNRPRPGPTDDPILREDPGKAARSLIAGNHASTPLRRPDCPSQTGPRMMDASVRKGGGFVRASARDPAPELAHRCGTLALTENQGAG